MSTYDFQMGEVVDRFAPMGAEELSRLIRTEVLPKVQSRWYRPTTPQWSNQLSTIWTKKK